jgi:hypothetical protein
MPHTRTNDGNICGLHEYTRTDTIPSPHDIARAALLHLREIVREYPAENHGSLPDDPHACAKQVRDEILATLDRIDPAALAETVKGVKG